MTNNYFYIVIVSAIANSEIPYYDKRIRVAKKVMEIFTQINQNHKNIDLKESTILLNVHKQLAHR